MIVMIAIMIVCICTCVYNALYGIINAIHKVLVYTRIVWCECRVYYYYTFDMQYDCNAIM